MKERNVQPVSNSGPPMAKASPGCGNRKAGLSWDKVWDPPLPCLELVGLQAHGPVCVYRTLSLCQAGRGQQGKGGGGGTGQDALAVKLLEPASMD